MEDMKIAALVVVLFTGLGWAYLPRLVDTVLRRKRKQIDGAFERKLKAFLEVERDPEGADPKVAEECMRWASQMAYMESVGKVRHGMATRLAEAGIIDEARDPAAYVEVPDERWGMDNGWRTRLAVWAVCLVLGGVMAAPWLVPGAPAPNIIVLPVALSLLFVVLAAVMCDVRAKVLPYQLCALAAVPSVALAVLTWGVDGLPWCAASAVVATGVLWGSSKVAGLFGVRGAIGMGDIRLLPWCCLPLGVTGTLYGAVAGFGLLFVLALVVLVSRLDILSRLKEGCMHIFHEISGMIKGASGYVGAFMASPTAFHKGKKKEGEPHRRDPAKYLAMGPGIAVWLAVGYAVGCMSGSVTLW